MKKTSDLNRQVAHAIAACQDKKADKVSVLELDKASGAFTDFFVICSGTNPRQIQAIADEVEQRLGREAGLRPVSVEGYKQAEWVLLDYVDFVVHIFAERAREFYDLERLWRSAKKLDPSELKKPASRKPKVKTDAEAAQTAGEIVPAPKKRTSVKRATPSLPKAPRARKKATKQAQ
jgi:ribosome-associated protein